MKRLMIIALCSLVNMGLFAQNDTFISPQSMSTHDKYTFSDFFDALDADNGGAKLARILLEDCTELNMFVGRASNEANHEGKALFDISVRRTVVLQLKEVLEHLGKQVHIMYY